MASTAADIILMCAGSIAPSTLRISCCQAMGDLSGPMFTWSHHGWNSVLQGNKGFVRESFSLDVSEARIPGESRVRVAAPACFIVHTASGSRLQRSKEQYSGGGLYVNSCTPSGMLRYHGGLIHWLLWGEIVTRGREGLKDKREASIVVTLPLFICWLWCGCSERSAENVLT